MLVMLLVWNVVEAAEEVVYARVVNELGEEFVTKGVTRVEVAGYEVAHTFVAPFVFEALVALVEADVCPEIVHAVLYLVGREGVLVGVECGWWFALVHFSRDDL